MQAKIFHREIVKSISGISLSAGIAKLPLNGSFDPAYLNEVRSQIS